MSTERSYKTIYADPPWPEVGGGKIKRGADRHYPIMKVPEIAALNVPSDENAHLYLWVTNNFLPSGLEVMQAWGFRYVTMITWVKDRIGLGQYYRGATEHCLFGVKGRLPYREKPGGGRLQGITVIHAPRSVHSRKPREMRDMIEKVSHPPYLEMFAREAPEGWDVWGNEVESDLKLL